jgi:hypothetical protein
MSRSERSDAIRDAFLAALREQGASVESMADLAASEPNGTLRDVLLGLGRAGREVYLLRGVGFMNVHVRAEPPGWWNILKSVKRDLDLLAKELGVKTYYVLLIGREDSHIANGYIAADFATTPFARTPKSEEMKYSVNEKVHLDQNKRLLSIKKISTILLQAPQSAASNAP